VSDTLSSTFEMPSELPSDPVLREFYPEFVQRWLTDFEQQWPAIIGRGDVVELRRFGHTIKGSFLQFGLRDMSQAGTKIMSCSDNNDWKGAGEIVASLRAALLHLQSILPSIQSAGPGL